MSKPPPAFLCSCLRTGIKRALASDGYTGGLLLAKHLIFIVGMVLQRWQSTKTILINSLLVLCGARAEMSSRDGEQGPLLPKPCGPTDSALKSTGTWWETSFGTCGFQLLCLRICIIQISYVHCTGFTNSEAANAFYSTPLTRAGSSTGCLQGAETLHLGSA